jgi:hypothetical protein
MGFLDEAVDFELFLCGVAAARLSPSAIEFFRVDGPRASVWQPLPSARGPPGAGLELVAGGRAGRGSR